MFGSVTYGQLGNRICAYNPLRHLVVAGAGFPHDFIFGRLYGSH